MRIFGGAALASLLYFGWWSLREAGAAVETETGEGGSMFSDAIAAGESLLSAGYGNISQAGVDAIKRREGFSATVYNDQAGLPTIGYGHRVRVWESFPTGISTGDAAALLAADLASAVDTVNGLVDVDLSQAQFDALVSFVHNIGAGAFRNSTLLDMLNSGDYIGASEQFARWVYVTVAGKKEVSMGLAYRRADEARQFMA